MQNGLLYSIYNIGYIQYILKDLYIIQKDNTKELVLYSYFKFLLVFNYKLIRDPYINQRI